MNQPDKKSVSSPASKVVARPTAKLAVVLALPIIAAAALHLSIGSVLRNGLRGEWEIVVLGALAFGMTLATVGLAGAVTRGKLPLIVVPLGAAASAWLTGLAWQVAVGGLIEVMALLLLMMHVRHEEVARVRFSVVKLLTYGMTITITLMLLAVGLYSYAGFSRGVNAGRLQVSIVDGTVAALNQSLPLVVQGYVPEMTVDEFIAQQLPDNESLVQGLRTGAFTAAERAAFEEQLRQDGIDPAAVDLDRLFTARPEQREALFREIDLKINEARRAAVDAARNRVAESFGVTLSGTERVDAALKVILMRYVERFTKPNQKLVPPLLAISVFLTLELFTGIYLWLAWLFGAIIFSIYRRAGVVTKVEEDVRAIRYEVL